MIIHSVKFDRPFSGASLVAAPDLSVANPDDQVSATPPGLETPAQLAASQAADSDAVKTLLTEINQGIEQVRAQSEQQVGEVRALSVRLAKMIVTHVVGSSESMRTERLEELLRASLLRPETPVTAFVNPQDLANIDDALDSTGLDLQSDPSITIGECRVEYSSHDLISNLQEQLDQIEDRLLEVLKND